MAGDGAVGHELVKRQAPRGLVSAGLVVFRLAGLRGLAGKRGVLLGLVVMIPPLLAAVSVFGGVGPYEGRPGFVRLMAHASLQVIQPILLLFLCCAALGEEIEGQTLFYLLVRPVTRSAIVLGRLSAAVFASLLLLVPSVTLTYAITQQGESAARAAGGSDIFKGPLLGDLLVVTLLAVLFYGTFYLLLSVVVKRPVIVGIAVGVLESVLPTVPGNTALLSPKFHLAVIAYRLTGFPAFVVTHSDQLDMLPGLRSSLAVILVLSGVCLAGAVLIFRRRQFVF